jgi:hypothetical protein
MCNDTFPHGKDVYDQRKARSCRKKPVLVILLTAAAISALPSVSAKLLEI